MPIGIERRGYNPDEEEFKTPRQIGQEAIEKQHEAEEKFREELLAKEEEIFEEDESQKKIRVTIRDIGEKVVNKLFPGFNGKLEAAVKEMAQLNLNLRICRLINLSDIEREKLIEFNLKEIEKLNLELEEEKGEDEKIRKRRSIKDLEQDNQVLKAFKQEIKLL